MCEGRHTEGHRTPRTPAPLRQPADQARRVREDGLRAPRPHQRGHDAEHLHPPVARLRGADPGRRRQGVRGPVRRGPATGRRSGVTAPPRAGPIQHAADSVRTAKAAQPAPPQVRRPFVERVRRWAAELDGECELLVTNGVLPADLVNRNRQVAEAALRPWPPAFTHGDLQIDHVFVDGDEVTGIIDWSEAGRGDALFDLATLTLGHEECLGDVIAGYGTDVELDVIRAWWSLRSLLGVRWLVEHGFDAFAPGCEVDVLRSRM
ncbi:phosphotransferase [Streptomyces phaeochromogenes]|uniref:phosphotransferase n=1 Tax=Streptomyces phaeochromogenes TaxID=1923 RepID=UPI003869B442